jgi:hypothetical protein
MQIPLSDESCLLWSIQIVLQFQGKQCVALMIVVKFLENNHPTIQGNLFSAITSTPHTYPPPNSPGSTNFHLQLLQFTPNTSFMVNRLISLAGDLLAVYVALVAYEFTVLATLVVASSLLRSLVKNPQSSFSIAEARSSSHRFRLSLELEQQRLARP